MAQSLMTIIFLNISGLTAPAKRHWVTIGIIKLNPTFCCLPRNLNNQNQHRFMVKGWRTILHVNNSLIKAEVATPILDDTGQSVKVSKSMRMLLLNHHRMFIRGKVTLLNKFALHDGPEKYLIQLLIKSRNNIYRKIIVVRYYTSW